MTATSSTRTVEANGSPTVGAISPAAGTLSGGTVVTVTVSGMTDFTSSLPQVLFGGVPASGVTALSVTELSVTTPASPGRSVGAVTVTVNQGAATATLPAGFSFRPVLETPRLSGFGDYAVLATGAGDSINHMDQLVLGALASRTQGTEVNTSTVPPVFTVVGTDSRSGDLYTFETDAPYGSNSEIGWRSEGTERSGNTVELRSGVAGVSGTRGYTAFTGTVGGRSDIMIVSSRANCGRNEGFNNINPVTGRDSYCSVFGPEVYSEPFFATTNQALSFDWGAQEVNDHYEVYAFLVRVDPASGAIPTKAEALAATSVSQVGFHSLVMYGRGEGPSSASDVVFLTSTGDVPADGVYRFRFVNGTYDGTGGKALGATMNIDPNIVVGLKNLITFAPLDDQVGAGSTSTLTVSALSGQPVTVISADTSACTVSASGSSWSVTTVASGKTCTLRASQGAVGEFAAASTVTRSFRILNAAEAPGAPTITGVTPAATSVSVVFQAGGNGGSAITGYEYSIDDGSTWTPVPGSALTSPLSISGLTATTAYDVRIRAVNAVGPGTQSNRLAVTTTSTPPPVVVVLPAPVVAVTPTTTTVPPTTTTVVPVPVLNAGVAPILSPGVSQVLIDGVAETVEVFVDGATDLVLRGQDFELRLAGDCSQGCQISTTADGRQVLELEESGLAKVAGEGFLPGTPVYVWLFSEPTFLGELTVDADGSFTGSVALGDVAAGEHTLQVNGTSFDGLARTANLGVVVTPLPTTLPAAGSDPLSVWVLALALMGLGLILTVRRRPFPGQI